MNFGDSDKEGKAEAESTPQGSRAFVSGSNGMGQAQSQSAGGDCGDCATGSSSNGGPVTFDGSRPDPLTKHGYYVDAYGRPLNGDSRSPSSSSDRIRDGTRPGDGGNDRFARPLQRGDIPGTNGGSDAGRNQGYPGGKGNLFPPGSGVINGNGGTEIGPDGRPLISGPGNNIPGRGTYIPGSPGSGSGSNGGPGSNIITPGTNGNSGTPGGPGSRTPGGGSGSLVGPDGRPIYPDNRGPGGSGSVIGPDGRPVYPDNRSPGSGSSIGPDGRPLYPDNKTPGGGSNLGPGSRNTLTPGGNSNANEPNAHLIGPNVPGGPGSNIQPGSPGLIVGPDGRLVAPGSENIPGRQGQPGTGGYYPVNGNDGGSGPSGQLVQPNGANGHRSRNGESNIYTLSGRDHTVVNPNGGLTVLVGTGGPKQTVIGPNGMRIIPGHSQDGVSRQTVHTGGGGLTVLIGTGGPTQTVHHGCGSSPCGITGGSGANLIHPGTTDNFPGTHGHGGGSGSPSNLLPGSGSTGAGGSGNRSEIR